MRRGYGCNNGEDRSMEGQLQRKLHSVITKSSIVVRTRTVGNLTSLKLTEQTIFFSKKFTIGI